MIPTAKRSKICVATLQNFLAAAGLILPVVLFRKAKKYEAAGII